MTKQVNCLKLCSIKLVCGVFVFVCIVSCQDSNNNFDKRRQQVILEIDSVLIDQYGLWYPRVIDNEYGGFLSSFSYDWKPVGSQNKMIVTQARHTWALSTIAHRDPSRKGFIKYAKHGFEFLRDVMWDEEYGGFYTLVSRRGEVKRSGNAEIRKTLYGNAFGIYGLATYYQVSGDTAALQLAKKAFYWLEKGSHDAKYGGYFQHLTREGEPYRPEGHGIEHPKDYNSSIHILEALTKLYQVWPDEVVRDRLVEMVRVVRDIITTDKGYMNLYFRRDWTSVTWQDSSRILQKEHLDMDHVSFGHDIETAFLLIEAYHALGISEDSVLSVAKKMVDHTIENAWDEEAGGIYNSGYYFQGDEELTVTDSSKVWWAQAEALHSLLIMAYYFPDDPHNYFDLFVKQWNYIKTYLLDPKYGGWYISGIDENPEAKKARKATIWKGPYHTVRALLRSKILLNKMNNE